MTYLPALLTEQEAERIRASKKFDDIWSSLDRKPIQSGIEILSDRLDLDYVSFSIFDEAYEKRVFDTIYGEMVIPRRQSIAAHALYQEDILVVLDTHKVIIPT